MQGRWICHCTKPLTSCWAWERAPLPLFACGPSDMDMAGDLVLGLARGGAMRLVLRKQTLTDLPSGAWSSRQPFGTAATCAHVE